MLQHAQPPSQCTQVSRVGESTEFMISGPLCFCLWHCNTLNINRCPSRTGFQVRSPQAYAFLHVLSV